jgi:hypothetical protein
LTGRDGRHGLTVCANVTCRRMFQHIPNAVVFMMTISVFEVAS